MQPEQPEAWVFCMEEFLTGSASYKISSALNHKRLLPSALYITCSCISGRTFLTGTDTLQLLLETVLAEKSFHSPQPYAIHHPVFDKQGTTNINQKALYSIKSIQFWIN